MKDTPAFPNVKNEIILLRNMFMWQTAPASPCHGNGGGGGGGGDDGSGSGGGGGGTMACIIVGIIPGIKPDGKAGDCKN